MMSEQARQARDEGLRFGLGVPVLVLALAFVAWNAFQTTALLNQRSSLAALRANQEQPLAELDRLRVAVQAMVNDTVKLADSGNPTAREIVDGFAKQGIKLNPPPAQH